MLEEKILYLNFIQLMWYLMNLMTDFNSLSVYILDLTLPISKFTNPRPIIIIYKS